MRVLPLEIFNEIIGWLSYDDIVSTELTKYVTENVWKYMLNRDFPDTIHDPNNHRTYNNWKDYYHYVKYMKFGRNKSSCVSVVNDYKIYFYNVVVDRGYVNLKDIMESSTCCNMYYDYTFRIYDIVGRMKRGDILKIISLISNGDIYIIDEIDGEKCVRLTSYRYFGFNNPSPLKPIVEFPISYWIDVPNSRNLYILQINPVELNVQCERMDIDQNEVYLFKYENIAYSFIFHNKYGKSVFDNEIMLFLPFSTQVLSDELLNVLKSHKISNERTLIYGRRGVACF